MKVKCPEASSCRFGLQCGAAVSHNSSDCEPCPMTGKVPCHPEDRDSLSLESIYRNHLKTLVAEMETFCSRVDKGEVRSVRTYSRFKSLVETVRKDLPQTSVNRSYENLPQLVRDYLFHFEDCSVGHAPWCDEVLSSSNPCSCGFKPSREILAKIKALLG